MLVSPNDLPASDSTEVPEFRTLTGTKRDTFVALLQVYATYPSPCGKDVINQLDTLKPISSEQTIYRALDELVDDGYISRTNTHSRKRTYVPTKGGLAAYCRARESELHSQCLAAPTLASFI